MLIAVIKKQWRDVRRHEIKAASSGTHSVSQAVNAHGVQRSMFKDLLSGGFVQGMRPGPRLYTYLKGD